MRRGLKSASSPQHHEHRVDVGRDHLLLVMLAGGAALDRRMPREHRRDRGFSRRRPRSAPSRRPRRGPRWRSRPCGSSVRAAIRAAIRSRGPRPDLRQRRSRSGAARSRAPAGRRMRVESARRIGGRRANRSPGADSCRGGRRHARDPSLRGVRPGGRKARPSTRREAARRLYGLSCSYGFFRSASARLAHPRPGRECPSR